MKTRRMRIALLLSLCLVIASLVTVLIVSAEEDAGVVTVQYANGTVETFAEGEEILPIAVPTDFARCDDEGDAYKFVVKAGAEWSFTLNGKALTNMTVTEDMLGETVYADVEGQMEGEKLFYTIYEDINDITVPEEMRGYFMIYGYDEQSLVKYLSRDNTGDGSMDEPRYRYLRQRDNKFYITLYQDMYPTKFDPRWGSAGKEWELSWQGTIYKVQDRTWRGDKFEADGVTPAPVGTSAKVYFNLNGHKVEIGASESFHFGSMAMTPYSMRLYIYSTTPGAVFSGAKSEAVFYSDDDTMITVGELDGATQKYGQNLSVYGKRVAHVNYGGGVYLYGGRYYQVGATDAFINVSHRLYAMQNCEFHVADQTEALLFFNNGQKSGWAKDSSASASNNLKITNCIFYVDQHGTQLLKEVSSQASKDLGDTKPPDDQGSDSQKFTLRFDGCSFYGIPTAQRGCYLKFSYLGDTVYSVGTDENYGTTANPVYISYVKDVVSTITLYDSIGQPFTATASCALRPANEVACVDYLGAKTYWEPGVTPFVYDKVVMKESERYVESEGRYLGLPATLQAGRAYLASGVEYGKRTYVAFVYLMESGIEGFGLAGKDAVETGINFSQKVGNLSNIKITLLSDLVLTTNVDFGTKGEVLLDLNGYKITIAENAKLTGAAHRAGDGLALRVYSSRPGAVYENLSTFPIFSLSHGGKGGEIEIGDYTYSLNDTYSGQNVSFVSAGSFFVGNPMNAGVEASAIFKAKNVNLIYTGDGAAFICANDLSIDRARIVMQPKNANATPVAIATRSDSVATSSCSNTSFYAPKGVSAIAYACLDGKGASVNAVDLAQRVSYNNVAFYNMSASAVSSVEGVELAYAGNMAFDTLDALRNFYEGAFPQDKLLVRGSSQFYLDGKLQYIPLWQCATAKDVVTVTFNSGKAYQGSFTEEWVKGAVACHESFIVDGIFVYSYGTREVGANSNVLTAGCTNLVPGSLRVNLSLEGELKLNLWVPMDSPITALTVSGKKIDIATTLDYKGNYYLVQVPITPAQMMSVVNLIIQTENYRETLTLPLSSYVAGLLDNDSVSIEEKYALYALMELAEQVSSKDLAMDAPLGYDSLTVEPADAPTLSGNIGNIAFDITKNGTVLVVDGTSGAQIAVVFADGTRVEGKIQGGTFRLADIPAYLLLGDITVECGQASYVYSIGVYKKSLNEVYHARADVLYTYAYYAAQMHAASVGA